MNSHLLGARSQSSVSWEFVFQFTLIGILILPIIFRFLKPSAVSLSLLALFPPLLSLSIYLWRFQGDLPFHITLMILSWWPSLFWGALLFKSQTPTSLRHFYSAIAGVAVVSGIIFFITPSLTLMDPFIGVWPGTVSIDPIISLNLFWQRFFLTLSCIVVFFVFKKRLSFFGLVSCYFVLGLGLSLVTPNSFTPRFRLEASFKKFEAAPFTLWIEKPDSLTSTPQLWLSELRFQWTELTKKLPPGYSFRRSPDISIFVYASDDSKHQWIGAGKTQIGNFLRHEMHLSSVEIDADVIRHELVHMLHGFLDVDLKSYIDPFYFEGFAVALSDENVEQLEQRASAIFHELGSNFVWPRGLRFFSAYPPVISYELAGAHSRHALTHQNWPWSETPNTSVVSAVRPNEEAKRAAQQWLKRKPLFSDPLARDCHRLRKNIQEPSYESWKDYLQICQTSPLSYEMIFDLDDKRAMALLDLSKMPHPFQNEILGDLAALESRPQDAELLYQKCEDNRESCRLKKKLLRHKPDLLRPILLKERNSTRAILRIFMTEPSEFRRLLAHLTLGEKKAAFEELKRLRPLTDQELYQFLSVRFYLGENSTELLGEAKGLKEKNQNRFLSRLNFQ